MNLKTTPQAAHSRYVQLTGYQIPFSLDCLYAWERWCLEFDLADLELLVRFIQRKQRNGQPSRSLIFRQLISGPSSIQFAHEDLAQARAERRAYIDPAKASVLKATGRPSHGLVMKPKSAGEVMTDSNWLEKWNEMKKGLESHEQSSSRERRNAMIADKNLGTRVISDSSPALRSTPVDICNPSVPLRS